MPWRAPSICAASAFASGWAIMSPKGLIVVNQDDAFDEQIYQPNTLIMHGLREVDGQLHAVGMYGARFRRSGTGNWDVLNSSLFRSDILEHDLPAQSTLWAGIQ